MDVANLGVLGMVPLVHSPRSGALLRIQPWDKGLRLLSSSLCIPIVQNLGCGGQRNSSATFGFLGFVAKGTAAQAGL